MKIQPGMGKTRAKEPAFIGPNLNGVRQALQMLAEETRAGGRPDVARLLEEAMAALRSSMN